MRVQHQVPRPRRASDKPSVRQRAVTPATVLFSFAAIIATDVPAARRALNLASSSAVHGRLRFLRFRT